MNVIGGIVLVILVCIHNSSGNIWSNRKIHCGVSVWSDWTAWTAPAPGGTRHRSRTIVRNNRNGGNPCPEFEETVSRSGETQQPRDRQNVPKKFHNKFMTGHTHYYSFVHGDAAVVGPSGVSAAGGSGTGGALTLLPRDLLFIIDMSGSISRSAWTLTKQKLADLIERLCGTIGRGNQNNRIAIVTFSSRVVLNFNFKTHWTIASVKRAILSMPQDRQLTCTGDAFEYAQEYMFEPDTGIRSATESVKEVLVLTDGQSNCGADLSREVRRLQVKAFVFALAIGNYIAHGKAEIQSMVSRPLIDHIFSLANFIEFRRMVDAIMQYPDKCVPFELS